MRQQALGLWKESDIILYSATGNHDEMPRCQLSWCGWELINSFHTGRA